MGSNALAALYNPEAARGLTETYVLEVDDEVFTARLEDGRLHAATGAADDADVRVEMDADTFFALTNGELTPAEAVEQGRAQVDGDRGALERCFRVLTLAPRVAVAA